MTPMTALRLLCFHSTLIEKVKIFCFSMPTCMSHTTFLHLCREIIFLRKCKSSKKMWGRRAQIFLIDPFWRDLWLWGVLRFIVLFTIRFPFFLHLLGIIIIPILLSFVLYAAAIIDKSPLKINWHFSQQIQRQYFKASPIAEIESLKSLQGSNPGWQDELSRALPAEALIQVIFLWFFNQY